VNYYILVACILVAWFLQNVLHELSHLYSGWRYEGRKPKKLIPWPHMFEGRFYWARYECGEATVKNVFYEMKRHSAPLATALIQPMVVVAVGMLLESYGVLPVYVLPFFVAPLVDALVWFWGYFMNREGTDGYRWKQVLGEERSEK